MIKRYESQNAPQKKEAGESLAPQGGEGSLQGIGRNTASGEASSEGYYQRHFADPVEGWSVEEQDYRQYNSVDWAALPDDLVVTEGYGITDTDGFSGLFHRLDESNPSAVGQAEPLEAEIIPPTEDAHTEIRSGAQSWPARENLPPE